MPLGLLNTGSLLILPNSRALGPLTVSGGTSKNQTPAFLL